MIGDKNVKPREKSLKIMRVLLREWNEMEWNERKKNSDRKLLYRDNEGYSGSVDNLYGTKNWSEWE